MYGIGQKYATAVVSVGCHAYVNANVVEQFFKIAHGRVGKFIQPFVVVVIFHTAPVLTHDQQFRIKITVQTRPWPNLVGVESTQRALGRIGKANA